MPPPLLQLKVHGGRLRSIRYKRACICNIKLLLGRKAFDGNIVNIDVVAGGNGDDFLMPCFSCVILSSSTIFQQQEFLLVVPHNHNPSSYSSHEHLHFQFRESLGVEMRSEFLAWLTADVLCGRYVVCWHEICTTTPILSQKMHVSLMMMKHQRSQVHAFDDERPSYYTFLPFWLLLVRSSEYEPVMSKIVALPTNDA